MKAIFIHKTTIAQHFVVAIEYGDYSGMSEQDISDLEDYMADNGIDDCIAEYSEESYFGTCNVTGLGANVVDVKFYSIVPDGYYDY